MRFPIFSAIVLSVVLACPFVVAQDGFVSLFNGKDLTGWTVKGGDAKYHVEDGSIVGVVNDERRNTFLCSNKEYENFIFKVEFKFDKNFNSGIQFRSLARPEGDRERVYGYQCEMESAGMTAAIYDEGRRGRWLNVVTDEFTEKTKKHFKQGEWNELEIQCVGPSIRTWLNGQPISDIFDIETQRGFFGLQVHSAKNPGQVRWRNIRVKELPSTPWVPMYANKKFDEDIEIKPVGEWTIQDDGVLCGRTPEGEKRDGIIVTKKTYKNFAAKVSYNMEKGNSGLYFRAIDVDKPYWLAGYQCEIAESPKVNANFWEVQGRGWIQKTPETEAIAEKATKPSDWNHIGTVAVNDRLVSFLNTWMVMDIIDPSPTHGKEGKIGLQLHGGGNQGCLFNDFYIMPLSEEMVKLITR